MDELRKNNLMEKFNNEIRERIEKSPYMYCLVKTCDVSPEQYDVYNKEGYKVAYIRLRYSTLSCECPDSCVISCNLVYKRYFEDNENYGCFDSEEIRTRYLLEIFDVIDKFYHDNTIRYVCEDEDYDHIVDVFGDGEINISSSELPIYTKLMEYEKKVPLVQMLPDAKSVTLDDIIDAYKFLSKCNSTTQEALRGATNLIAVLCSKKDIIDTRVPKFDNVVKPDHKM